MGHPSSSLALKDWQLTSAVPVTHLRGGETGTTRLTGAAAADILMNLPILNGPKRGGFVVRPVLMFVLTSACRENRPKPSCPLPEE